MILILHIAIALLSVVVATYSYFNPSKRLIRTTQLMGLVTLISGSYLIVTSPSHLVQACFSGIAYFGGVMIMIVLTQKKLAKQKAIN